MDVARHLQRIGQVIARLWRLMVWSCCGTRQDDRTTFPVRALRDFSQMLPVVGLLWPERHRRKGRLGSLTRYDHAKCNP